MSLARKAVDLCNCRRREAAAECLVEKQVELVSFAEDPVMVVATLRLDVALAGGVVERTLTTEPALLAAHVCKAGALFGVAEGELVSNGAGVASGVGAADPDGTTAFVALKKNGIIRINDAKGRELEHHKVPYGGSIVVRNGDQVKRGQGTLGALVFDQKAADDLRTSIANLRAVSDKINRGEGTLGKLLGDDSLLRDAQAVMRKAERALDGLDDSGPITAVGVVSRGLF